MTATTLLELHSEQFRIGAWLIANAGNKASFKYRQGNLSHQLLTELCHRNGGNGAERRYVLDRLKEIENGTHPELAGLRQQAEDLRP